MDNPISTVPTKAADGEASSTSAQLQRLTNDSQEQSAQQKSASRKRTSAGRFMSADGCDPAEATRRKRRAFLNMETGKDLFEQLLDVVFLEGAPEDWIPGRANSGPLFALAERLMKKSYLPSAPFRLRMALNRHFNYDLEKQQKHLPSLWVKPAERTNEQGFRVRVFKGRRLPRLSRQSVEVKNVMKWVEKAESLSVLKPSSIKEAHQVLTEILSSYKCCDDGKWRYEGYPSDRVDGKGEDSPDCEVHTQNQHTATDKEQENEQRQAEVPSGSEVQALVNRLEAERVLNIVQNERLFNLICMVGYDEEPSGDVVRGVAGGDVGACGGKADAILESTLLYALLKGRAGTGATEKQVDVVRKRVQENIQLLKSYRKQLKLC